MELRSLGETGPRVSAIGLGCMAMSGMYGPSDRGESIATVRTALDAGITLLDTADFHGMEYSRGASAASRSVQPPAEHRVSPWRADPR